MALSSVSTLLERFGDAVWRADALAEAASADGGVLPSGHALLDVQLPGGGWPLGALSEVLQVPGDAAEWRLLLPALSTLNRSVVLVGAPHLPFGPALAAQGLDLRRLIQVQASTVAQRLWAAEQALRCSEVAALLVWLSQVRSEHLRRLHLAAQAHRCLLCVFRPASAQGESSPAVLRLLLGVAAGPPTASSPEDDLAVQILKRRGPPLSEVLQLPARPVALSAVLAFNAVPLASAAGWVGPTRSAVSVPEPLTGDTPTPWPEPAYALDRLVAAA
ncbi:translesion DNA synthesis-associated protein ImuA [Rhodoferax sp. BLA1]|uniref:translesion DNA synthesis-associated protein ImuA n=1 Tax=Rhodoferax sp. BLA1 TaxID=2576062 RepID=UPI0015D26F47|nr:translesion DNA synthesis-associated protein ImuA [Rhodoferax sp. BLA1]